MHPILFAIGSFYIGTYGLMLALGMLAGAAVAMWRAKQLGLPLDRLMDLIFLTVLAGLLGGRITYIVVYFDEFLRAPMAMILSREGFVFLGGVIGGALAVAFLVRRFRLPFWRVADVLASALPLGHAFGRIGCFMAGCCYGRPVSPHTPLSFLAVRFPAQSTAGDVVYPGGAFAEHVAHHGLSPDAVCSLPVWPTQLFESAGNLAIFAALVLFWGRRRFHGQVFLLYLALYSLLRIAVETLRGDPRGAIGPLSTSQIISLACLLFVALWWRRLAATRPLPEATSAAPPTETTPRSEKRRKKRSGKRGNG